jgi:hypothetical protein
VRQWRVAVIAVRHEFVSMTPEHIPPRGIFPRP